MTPCNSYNINGYGCNVLHDFNSIVSHDSGLWEYELEVVKFHINPTRIGWMIIAHI